MGNLIDDFGGDGADTPRSRFLTKAAHTFPLAVGVVFGTNFAIDIWGSIGTIPIWVSLISVAFTAVCFFLLLIFNLHGVLGRLCIRCMQGVPADASFQAERRKWLLYLNHHYTKFMLLGFLLIGIASWVVQPLLMHTTGPSAIMIPGDSIMLMLVTSIWVHHRYRPWCPYCKRWDNGGEREVVPTPDPTGAVVDVH